jgi:hypothetical protein
MSNRALVLLGGLTLILFSVTAGWTQTDLTKLLVGRWTGEVQTATGSYDRTLVIKSVEDRNGQPVAAGEYGGQGTSVGSKLLPVQGMVEMINGEVVVRIFTPERQTAVLTLSKDAKRLMGSVSGANQVGRSAHGDDSLNLRKVE